MASTAGVMKISSRVYTTGPTNTYTPPPLVPSGPNPTVHEPAATLTPVGPTKINPQAGKNARPSAYVCALHGTCYDGTVCYECANTLIGSYASPVKPGEVVAFILIVAGLGFWAYTSLA